MLMLSKPWSLDLRASDNSEGAPKGEEFLYNSGLSRAAPKLISGMVTDPSDKSHKILRSKSSRFHIFLITFRPSMNWLKKLYRPIDLVFSTFVWEPRIWFYDHGHGRIMRSITHMRESLLEGGAWRETRPQRSSFHMQRFQSLCYDGKWATVLKFIWDAAFICALNLARLICLNCKLLRCFSYFGPSGFLIWLIVVFLTHALLYSSLFSSMLLGVQLNH
jgi:hypothetical protein